MNNACTIFIPLYNEEDIVEKNALRLMDFMRTSHITGEIILGSNGSTDATPEIIKSLAKTTPGIKSFHLNQKGPGAAFLCGVNLAAHEFIVSLDADLAVELDFIPLALDFLEKCDMVIGCKRMRFQNRSWLRTVGSNFFIFTAATVLGAAAADFSIGAKAYRRSFVLSHAGILDSWTAYVLELFYYAVKEKRRVVEFPVDCTDTRDSHFTLSAEALYKFKHLFRFARSRKNLSARVDDV
jgi:glycosyltransferase involved in cell wall biosynthesis